MDRKILEIVDAQTEVIRLLIETVATLAKQSNEYSSRIAAMCGALDEMSYKLTKEYRDANHN